LQHIPQKEEIIFCETKKIGKFWVDLKVCLCVLVAEPFFCNSLYSNEYIENTNLFHPKSTPRTRIMATLTRSWNNHCLRSLSTVYQFSSILVMLQSKHDVQ
jgi:hypothetical protein